MLDYFCIFARGGALLWTLELASLEGNPVGALVQNCLLEDRAGLKSYDYKPPHGAPYTLKWTLHNGLGLVFVAVYQKALSLLYVDSLLEKIKSKFAAIHKPGVYDYNQFEDTFRKVLKDCEAKADTLRRQGDIRTPSSKKGGGNGASKEESKEKTDDDEDNKKLTEPMVGKDENQWEMIESNPQEQKAEQNGSSAFDMSKFRKVGPGRKGRGHPEKPKKEATPPRKGKIIGKVTASRKEDNSQLDYSNEQSDIRGTALEVEKEEKSRMDVDDEDAAYSDEEEEISGMANGETSQKSGILSSFLRGLSVNVVGSSGLSREDIEKALEDMKRKLMERNVAEEIAAKLVESVTKNLEGQKLKSFTRVSTVVRDAFEKALIRIMTPNRTINILAEVEKSKARSKPYVIVFVGVNGVGKSTNLSKVAYWLLQNKHKVMIAACDTFRAGAVEQLRTHCQRLQVPLYERGYEKDPAKVAYEAARQAERDDIDVLLVDTAGRMQDNEPLMRALSSLINLNQPDLVLFVGEALVGNDAVDQLTKFNQRLADLATTPKPQLIDGIVLTKFDTIDDKVGAALSMVYTSGAPIMFVGCGQTYVDLKRLQVKSVVKSLLK